MRYLGFATLVFLMGSWLVARDQPIPWEQLYKKDGIEVFRAKLSGSKFVAFRGTATISTTPDLIVDVFKDAPRWKEWTDLLLSGKILEPRKANHLIFYQAFDSPPFIRDRDAVYDVHFKKDPSSGIVTVVGKSREYPQAPETVGVRMDIDFSRWTLTPKDGKTYVELEMHADPGGWIPSWVVNMVQRDYAYDLLFALRRQAHKILRERNLN
ncbi:START domain-containing protein [Pseudobacteriovorax antillogorgiicola]|uniref:START domain-containing protein n=1 Tax=Pseudobacteriovorax antillogorgiicola TaxID=1513793 RepID=A0A1Y6C4M2_9BACT|nr:START domain-containing protein [Pseudobacteriovorax antillogorgiicola]TCS51233.1 START domain-containing protein [Pseudobacteriovorax antillogorgiicola]SMF36842.1 START domain-containing protein [Pseudobacteriovorax antillogorgiicola]